MKLRRRWSLVLSGAMFGSFTLGLSLPDVLAGAGNTRLAQGGLPERYVLRRAAGEVRSGLDPLPAYRRILDTLKQKYVGQLPGDVRLTYAAIRGMIRPLDDPYTRFLDPEQYQAMREKNLGQYIGLGAAVSPRSAADGYPRIEHVRGGTLAAQAGLRTGDVILKIDGVSVRHLSAAKVEQRLRGPIGAPVRLTLRRQGAARPLQVRILRQPVDIETVASWMLTGNVGFISLAEFNERCDTAIDRALTRLERQGMRALILDLRGNGGGVLDAAQEVASRFLPRGKTVVTIVERSGDPDIRPVLERQHNHRINQPGRMVPLVVLVNRMSASASEIVAGALQDHGAGLIVGTPTYGKGLVQTVVPLRGGAAIAVTSAHYLTPKGHDINRRRDGGGGIMPDLRVEASEQDWLNGRDVQLHAALELLHQKIGYRKGAGRRV